MRVIYINLLAINFKSLVNSFKLRVKSFNTPINCFNSSFNCFKLDAICFKLGRKWCRNAQKPKTKHSVIDEYVDAKHQVSSKI